MYNTPLEKLNDFLTSSLTVALFARKVKTGHFNTCGFVSIGWKHG